MSNIPGPNVGVGVDCLNFVSGKSDFVKLSGALIALKCSTNSGGYTSEHVETRPDRRRTGSENHVSFECFPRGVWKRNLKTETLNRSLKHCEENKR